MRGREERGHDRVQEPKEVHVIGEGGRLGQGTGGGGGWGPRQKFSFKPRTVESRG